MRARTSSEPSARWTSSPRRSAERATHWYPEPGLVHRAYRLLLSNEGTGVIDEILDTLDAEVRMAKGSAAPYIRTFCMLIRSVQGRYELSWDQSEALGGRLERVVPFVHVADHTFLRGLAAAELATRARGRQRRRYRQALRKAKKSLRSWSERGPDFVHMYTFLEGESVRLRKQVARARELYGRAAARAEQQGFLHHAALAYERRSAMLEATRQKIEADRERRRAITFYSRWGAVFKVQAMEEGMGPESTSGAGSAQHRP